MEINDSDISIGEKVEKIRKLASGVAEYYCNLLHEHHIKNQPNVNYQELDRLKFSLFSNQLNAVLYSNKKFTDFSVVNFEDLLLSWYLSNCQNGDWLQPFYQYFESEFRTPLFILFNWQKNKQEDNKTGYLFIDEKIFSRFIQQSLIIHTEPFVLTGSDINIEGFDLNLYNQLRTNPDLLKQINWRSFEELMADILKTFGYEVELTQQSKDGGVDIFAVNKKSPLGEHKYILQAKRWKDKVGIEPVQRLLFLKDEYLATKACLVTTSDFTKGAWNLAEKYLWQLELKEYSSLQDWISQVIDIKKRKN